MITVSIISLVFSFLLQGLMSNIFNFNIGSLSVFCTIYLVVNMVVLQQYFDYDKKYLIIISIFGLMMDIVYSSTALFNVFIFIGFKNIIHFTNYEFFEFFNIFFRFTFRIIKYFFHNQPFLTSSISISSFDNSFVCIHLYPYQIFFDIIS